MKNTNEKLLKEINIDIIFFFLAAIKAGVSFYLINEKKKSALNIESINNTTANKIYYYNRRLNLINSHLLFPKCILFLSKRHYRRRKKAGRTINISNLLYINRSSIIFTIR